MTNDMMRFSYTLFFYLLLPFVVLRLYWRSIKVPAYRARMGERFAFVPFKLAIKQPVIWVHTVSVGETLAAKPVIDALLEENADCQLVITTTTPTGSAQVQALFFQALQEQHILHCYMPYDLPNCIARFLNCINPVAAFFMETEIWPNTLLACRKRRISTMLMNARLSEKSLRGYQRFSSLSKQAVACFSCIAAQSQADADRLSMIGGKNIIVTGSIKLDISLDDVLVQKAKLLKQQWSLQGKRKIIIAASTHAGEDEMILNAFQTLLQQYANILLLLVPRHPERFVNVYESAKKTGFSTALRSQYQNIDTEVQVVVGDTMGELMLLYGVADIAIVGGGFVPHGGHNMLEPALWGLPIISGKSVFNFSTISEDLINQGGLRLIDSDQLLQVLSELLANPIVAARLGSNAQHYVNNNRGALSALLGIMQPLIAKCLARPA